MEENQHNYHDQYYGDNDYEPEDEGEVVEGYGDGEYLDTEFDPEHGKYYYMEDVSLPMPLHTLMSKFYGDSITMFSPSMPYKEVSGAYNQMMCTVNSGHSTRVLVADSESTIPVIVKCGMERLAKEGDILATVTAMASHMRKDIGRGRYLVHSGMGREVTGEECLGPGDEHWMAPLSVVESKLRSELGEVEVGVEGSASKLPTATREQRVTQGAAGIMDCNTLVTMFPGTSQ